MSKLYFLTMIFCGAVALAQSESSDTLPPTLDDVEMPTDSQFRTKTNPPDKKQVAPPKRTGQGNVLDFEGEVIEGERRRPDLFLQMSIDNVKFDSLIYQREDFNDYLEVDRKGRTRYLKLK